MSQLGIHPRFALGAPSNQQVADIFAGAWKTRFPDELGIEAGKNPYFEDTRPTWTGERIGGLAGKRVLELGPFEAYNTYQLAKAGAHVTAIEASNVNYLKCLVVKELLDFPARFLHGDFTPYLESTDDTYDLCFSSGVLYHQMNPLALLRGLAHVAPAVFIWTHHYSPTVLENEKTRPYFADLEPVVQELDGFSCTHYPRSYNFAEPGKPPAMFSGGLQDVAHWLTKDDIFAYLDAVGLGNIEVRAESDHPAGPVISFLAKRS